MSCSPPEIPHAQLIAGNACPISLPLPSPSPTRYSTNYISYRTKESLKLNIYDVPSVLKFQDYYKRNWGARRGETFPSAFLRAYVLFTQIDMARQCCTIVFPAAFVLLLLGSANAQLGVGFYRESCPDAEAIVRAEISRVMRVAPTLGGPLLRLFFHDCFVRVLYLRLHSPQR